MKAAICPRYGPPEVLKIVEREAPTPKEDEVLIRVFAASVTNSDLFIRGCDIPLRFQIPMRIMIGITRPRNEIIGEVLAGEIVQVGPKIRHFKVGDRVFGLTGFSLGAYAEYKCMKETASKRGSIALKPGNISFEDATSAAYGGLLAFQFLERGHIQPGQHVLIYGASGTTGTMAVQYARHLGAIVTGVCSTDKVELVRSLGADKTIDYTRNDAVSKLESYDFALDAVGKARSSDVKEACKARMKEKGKFVSIDDGALLLDTNRLNRVRELVESGAIRPITDRCFPLDEIVDAHRYVETGRKRGNVAITVQTE